ncbi:uncharacterized protein LOC143080546 isoform X1 [Mytilus galloprovincialis]|uniref:uncharacterized protein LOC143080546 isoform X1 n=1 Tax=Mytilus galloprovincialis TaxID=29158 RepID=UPI003F7C455B
MEHAIEIIPWCDYLTCNTTRAWCDRDGRLDLSKETPDIKHRIKSDKNGAVFRVSSKSDLEDISSLLLSKYIILRVTLIHTQVGSRYASDSVTIWEGDYAVIINTKNSKVQNQFDKVFTDARINIDTGWNYSVEIDLSDIVEAWYLQHNEVLSGCDDFQTTKTKNCRITLTNYKPYMHCFDCSPRWWLFFGPCWLLSAPWYFLHRKLSCKDTRYSLIADTSPYRGYGHMLGQSDSRHSINTLVSYKSSGDVTTLITDNSTSYGTL